jgi:hypothetical protein
MDILRGEGVGADTPAADTPARRTGAGRARRITRAEFDLLTILWGYQQASRKQGIPFAFPSQMRLALRMRLRYDPDHGCRYLRTLLTRLKAAGLIRVRKPSRDDEQADEIERLLAEGKIKRPARGYSDVYLVLVDPDRLDEVEARGGPAPPSGAPRRARRRRQPRRPDRPDQPDLFHTVGPVADGQPPAGDDRLNRAGDDRLNRAGDEARAPLEEGLNLKREGEEEKPRTRAAQTPPEPARAGRPPTVEEVRTYARGRQSRVDPEHFHDYHQARGWRLSGAPIADWRAAYRSWEKNHWAAADGARGPAAAGDSRDVHQRAREQNDEIDRKYGRGQRPRDGGASAAAQPRGGAAAAGHDPGPQPRPG